METFGAWAAMAALVVKVSDLIKSVQSGKTKDAITQVLVWLVGVGAVILLANTSWADGIKVGDMVLGAVNGAGLVLLGLTVGSSASVIYDFSPHSTPSLGERAPD